MTQPVTGAQLFGRSCTVTIGKVQVTNIGAAAGFDIWFNIKRSLKPLEPSTCDLKLWNLADATRQAIESYTATGPSPATPPGSLSKNIISCQIDAGYIGNTATIFLGELRSAQTVQQGTNFVTEISTGDSDQAKLLARTSVSTGPGKCAYDAVLQLLGDMGCGPGNLASVQAALQKSPLFKSGYTLKGRSMAKLVEIARSCGLEVSMQAGIAQWCYAGQALGGQAFLLSSTPTNTGLIGSPTQDTKGIVHLETLLIPQLAPGQPIQVQARFVSGNFRILDIETEGDTHGMSWGHRIEAAYPGTAAP